MYHSIAGIVLAAGTSSRFHSNKLLYKVEGKPVIYRCISAIHAYCTQIVLVIQPSDVKIPMVVKEFSVDVVPNPQWKKGMTTSIKAGVKHLSDEVDAYVIMPADYPYIQSKDLEQFFIKVNRETPLLALPTYEDRGGHPLVISDQLQEELLNISEESQGLRGLLQRYQSQVMRIPVSTDGILHDIDYQNDLRSA